MLTSAGVKLENFSNSGFQIRLGMLSKAVLQRNKANGILIFQLLYRLILGLDQQPATNWKEHQ